MPADSRLVAALFRVSHPRLHRPPVSEARAAYDQLARRGSGANPEAEDDAVFEDEETDGWAEDADEAGVEWDEAA